MLRVAICALLALPAAHCFAGLTQTITSTQPIIDWPLCDCADPMPGVLDFALFNFDGKSLCSIDSMQFSMTIQDGDTGMGDFDYNNLSLALDGVDTGLKLNGFKAGEEDSLTFTLDKNSPNWNANAMQQILDKIKTDGQLFASIHDATPDDNAIQLYSSFDTTLSLTGQVCPDPSAVPEPATYLIWGAAGAVFAYRMRRRKA